MKNKLKQTIQANAAFSGLSGLALIFFRDQLARFMNINLPDVLLFIGIGLLLFASFLLWTARQQPIPLRLVTFIIWQDWLWVAGSGLLFAIRAFGISTVGHLLIGVVAVVVAIFAVLQHKYLRQLGA